MSVISGFAAIMAFQNCSPTKFTGTNLDKALNGANASLGTPTTSPPAFTPPCHDFAKLSVPLRIIVAIDVTGSTGFNRFATEHPDDGPYNYTKGSDNDQAFRQRSVNELVDSLSPLSNITYNMQYFRDAYNVGWRKAPNAPIAKSLINVGSNDQSPTFGTALDMKAAMKEFLTKQEDGGTEYFAPLNLIRKSIENDAGFASGQQNYAVVFMTDGQPTERLKPDKDGVIQHVPWKAETDEPELLAAIGDLVALAPGHISFGTVFFNDITPEERARQIAQQIEDQRLADEKAGHTLKHGPIYDPVDPLAPALLQKMAEVGLGQFADANEKGADNIKLNNVLTVPSAICPQ